LVVWVPLVLLALIRLRKLPLEKMTTEILGVMFYGYAVAAAVALVVSVIGALLPNLFFFLQFDITTVYVVAFLGAVGVLWFTATRFSREVETLRGKQEAQAKLPSGWTGGDPVVIAQEWVAARIRPLVVEFWSSGSPSEDEQGHIIVPGSALLKGGFSQTGLPYRFFRVVMTKGGGILYEESYVGQQPP